MIEYAELNELVASYNDHVATTTGPITDEDGNYISDVQSDHMSVDNLGSDNVRLNIGGQEITQGDIFDVIGRVKQILRENGCQWL